MPHESSFFASCEAQFLSLRGNITISTLGQLEGGNHVKYHQ